MNGHGGCCPGGCVRCGQQISNQDGPMVEGSLFVQRESGIRRYGRFLVQVVQLFVQSGMGCLSGFHCIS